MLLTSFFLAPVALKVGIAIVCIILALVALVFILICFSRIVTNSNYDGLCEDSCQSVLNGCKNKEYYNKVDLSFIKYTTEVRVGPLEVPTSLVELLRLYHWRSWVCKKQGVLIRPEIRKRSIKTDEENVPLQDKDGDQIFIYILAVLISNLI